MPTSHSFRLLSIALLILIGQALAGCMVSSRPHAYVYTAPGPAVYYDYWYYPDVEVYYDFHRHVYFYLNPGNRWVEARSLPPGLRVDLGRHVQVRSRYQRPYRDYDEHRRSYPSRHRDDRRRDDRRYEQYTPYERQQPPTKTWRDLNENREAQPDYRDNRNLPRENHRVEQRDNRHAPARNERTYERGNERRAEPPGKHAPIQKSGKAKANGKRKEKQKESTKDKRGKDRDNKGKSQDRDDRNDDQQDRRSRDRRERDDRQ